MSLDKFEGIDLPEQTEQLRCDRCGFWADTLTRWAGERLCRQCVKEDRDR